MEKLNRVHWKILIMFDFFPIKQESDKNNRNFFPSIHILFSHRS